MQELLEGYANCKSGQEVIDYQNKYMERIEQERVVDRSLDVGLWICFEVQLPPTDSEEEDADEFHVHSLNVKQTHSYMDVYGEEDEEDANYCADSDEGEYIQEEVAVDRKEYDEEDSNEEQEGSDEEQGSDDED